MAEKIKVVLSMQNEALYVRPAGIQEGSELHGKTVLRGTAVDAVLDQLPLAVYKDLISGWKLLAEIDAETYDKYRVQFASRK